jgi:uncharacterized protein YggL (DUF469 family)
MIILLSLPSKNRIRRLNTRQRKKFRVGEFQELVFSLRWTNRLDLSDDELNAQFDEFICMIEARGLLFGGAFSPSGDGIVTTDGRRSTTVEDRESVVIWLRNRAEVSTVDAGEFVDGWYGWDE